MSTFLTAPALPGEELNRFDYDQIAAHAFWKELYTAGGWTLYCGYRFHGNGRSPRGHLVGIEHIYPSDWMLQHVGCESRMQCRESGNEAFARMEADMHNLYPVWQVMTTYRYGKHYGVVDGEEWRFSDCDIEWRAGTLEPRPIARGNVARALLYMHHKYDLPLDSEHLSLMKKWNREDPPSRQERLRNDRIELLQGDRNPYIDEPTLAEMIGPVAPTENAQAAP